MPWWIKRIQNIKPCPFCGKEAKLSYALGKPFIECGNPECKIHPSTWLRVDEGNVKKLVAIWNKRA